MTFLDDVLEVKRAEIELLRQHPPSAAASSAPEFGRAPPRPGALGRSRRSSAARPRRAISLVPSTSPPRPVPMPRAAPSAISCLTDRRFFGARAGDVAQACGAGLPVLRKDFLIDEIQIDESVDLGVSAVLLIARILRARSSRGASLATRFRAVSMFSSKCTTRPRSIAPSPRALRSSA